VLELAATLDLVVSSAGVVEDLPRGTAAAQGSDVVELLGRLCKGRVWTLPVRACTASERRTLTMARFRAP
jgi:hypothetical protein